MAPLSMEEKATIFSYSILSSQLVLTIQGVMAGKKLESSERIVLDKGVSLLNSIIQGSCLVERQELPSGVTASIEDVAAYGYALSTLGVLNAMGKDQSLTDWFKSLRDSLDAVLKKDQKDENLKEVQKFFRALEVFFDHDLQKESYSPPNERFVSA